VLEDYKPEAQPVVNDLDTAYAEIPEAERDTWYERADRALEAAGMPEWMRITPTVKAAAVRMWSDKGISGMNCRWTPRTHPGWQGWHLSKGWHLDEISNHSFLSHKNWSYL